MYLGGHTRRQIAKLVRAATSTVGDHLAAARAADPQLQAEYEAAGALKSTHSATASSLEQAREFAPVAGARARTHDGDLRSSR
jgi:hypothetical protein